MFNAQELIDSEIRTILIGSAWRLHYEHTWSGLNFGLWNQPCFCESRNPQVFLTRVVPLTTIYIFEDINWSARPKHCKNSLGISADQSSKFWNTLGRFQRSFQRILNVFLTAGYLVFLNNRACESRSLVRRGQKNSSTTNIDCSHRVRTSIL